MKVKLDWFEKLFSFSGILFLQLTNLVSQLVILPIVINHGDTVSVSFFFLPFHMHHLLAFLSILEPIKPQLLICSGQHLTRMISD